ncbi:glycoside hydrolase [Pseudorhizobium endolithicum]|uniref:Glycoside hydrolase n=1 Tax=Pseudorhizobium endolithicum TaxID=1191678 RepID=A0ABM8PRC9_9HYPH|nr:glycosyltransferase family 4 protein [Pseudorhizobium endolithicum]CAD7044318.1 glycoside hydrolase [Pseudorhizobium endolithicum]
MNRNRKVVVSQLGARMHYAVPRIMASEGVLAHFYTDICATKGLPRLLRALPSQTLPPALERLAARRPIGIPADLISDFPLFGMLSAFRRLRGKDVLDETRHAVWAGSSFSKLVASRGFRGASGLYAFSGDALEQLREAKKQRLWTAVEQMIAPREVVEALHNGEVERFPEWAAQSENPFAQAFIDREKAEWELADIIVCPSEFVRNHVMACGGPVDRCVVVPYGVNQGHIYDRSIRAPGPLRVLTVGEVGLRKGSPYVVKAAELAGELAVFRMVGGTKVPRSVQEEIAQWVELRGVVPRSQITEEFRRADVFLLPSICEGSATAVYEALAAGLPVITTENTGSVVRDGVDGFIVPPRQPDSIVTGLLRLAEDDGLRQWMSHNAAERAKEYTVEAYGDRLIAALGLSGGATTALQVDGKPIGGYALA